MMPKVLSELLGGKVCQREVDGCAEISGVAVQGESVSQPVSVTSQLHGNFSVAVMLTTN